MVPLNGPATRHRAMEALGPLMGLLDLADRVRDLNRLAGVHPERVGEAGGVPGRDRTTLAARQALVQAEVEPAQLVANRCRGQPPVALIFGSVEDGLQHRRRGGNADLSPLLRGSVLLDDAPALRFQGPAIIFDDVGQLDQLGFCLLPLQAVRAEPATGCAGQRAVALGVGRERAGQGRRLRGFCSTAAISRSPTPSWPKVIRARAAIVSRWRCITADERPVPRSLHR